MEQKYVEDYYLDPYGFWKLQTTGDSWFLRVPHDMTQQVLWQYHNLCLCTNAIRPTRPDLLKPRVPKVAWDTISLDIMGPCPRTITGKKFILVVTDLFSKWTEAFPVGSSEEAVLSSLMVREVFSRWDYPNQILSDNGKQFSSQH